ncbi:MAG: hypothetical protein ACE5EO_02600 [Candidatus Krumholzibacteriia bacterium]
MKTGVRLRVWLKGTDLVTRTAYRTLCDKMGYAGRLLAIRRLDFAEFEITGPEPRRAVPAVTRMMSTQSEFYNRNKHKHLIEFEWGGDGRKVEGVPLEDLLGYLTRDVTRRQGLDDSQEFNGKSGPNQVNLDRVPIFRTEVLVEDRDPFPKLALAKRVESELSAANVTVSALGTCWYLAVRAASTAEAMAETERIVVSKSRDRGLLLNPNAQSFQVRSVERIGEL